MEHHDHQKPHVTFSPSYLGLHFAIKEYTMYVVVRGPHFFFFYYYYYYHQHLTMSVKLIIMDHIICLVTSFAMKLPIGPSTLGEKSSVLTICCNL